MATSASGKRLLRARLPLCGCRFTTYRHRFARVPPLLEQSSKIQRIVDARCPSTLRPPGSGPDNVWQAIIQLVFRSFAFLLREHLLRSKGASKMLRATGHARMVVKPARLHFARTARRAPLLVTAYGSEATCPNF